MTDPKPAALPAEQNMAHFNACPLCGGGRLFPRYRLSKLNVFQCPSCTMVFLNPYIPPAAMALLYSDPEALKRTNPRLAAYYDCERLKGGKTEKFFDSCMADLEKRLPPGQKSLLDIGCGNGFFLSRAKRLGWEVRGLEPSKKNCDLAREHYGVEAIPASFENYESREQYDCVSMWDFIEHLPSPLTLIEKAKRLIKPGGILLVATPNHFSLINFLADILYRGTFGRLQKPLEVLFVPEHILYFTKRTLCLAIKKSGFRILNRVTTGTDIDRFQTGRLFYITARALLMLSRWLRWENRVIIFAQKEN